MTPVVMYTNNLANGAANTALGTVADQAVTRNPNGGYMFPTDRKVVAAFGLIPDGTSLRIVSPTLRSFVLPHIDPFSVQAAPENNPPFSLFLGTGIPLEATEGIQVEASRGGAGAADAYAVLWIAKAVPTPRIGEIFTVRCTSAVVFAEGTWTLGALTFETQLPAGKYEIVGMSAYGANLLVARLVLPDDPERPGVLGQQAQGEFNLDNFRYGRLGSWGIFDAYNQPQVEMLGTGAGVTQVVYLDLIRRS